MCACLSFARTLLKHPTSLLLPLLSYTFPTISVSQQHIPFPVYICACHFIFMCSYFPPICYVCLWPMSPTTLGQVRDERTGQRTGGQDRDRWRRDRDMDLFPVCTWATPHSYMPPATYMRRQAAFASCLPACCTAHMLHMPHLHTLRTASPSPSPYPYLPLSFPLLCPVLPALHLLP